MTADWITVPVLLPLATAALMLLLGEQRRWANAALNVLSTSVGLVVAVLLAQWTHQQDAAAAFAVYSPGNWPVPFGIVLLADRLSALMCVLASCSAFAALLFALARWHRAGVYFHVLLQLQLMGLNGAFLTADLFNLFVFFEVLLAASYGLLLHGGESARVRAGLHYVAINLVASLLFLIGVALLYGVTGTLNMADLAHKITQVPESDRGLLHAGAAILALAFLAKAALWPLAFWLPSAYNAASTPAAALFAILSKVGVYAVLRLWTLCFPSGAGAAVPFGSVILIWGGLATLAFGAVGMLASQRLGRLAGYSVIASSGTLMAAIGLRQPDLTAGALFYLVSSTLAAGALFLLVELLERARAVEESPPLLDTGDMRLRLFAESALPQDVNLDDDEKALIGRAVPAALALIGVAFITCTMVIAGFPPLSGFVGKLAMLTALLEPVQPSSAARWALFTGLVVYGLFAATALVRVGMSHLWAPQERPAPRLRVIEGLPVALLLGGCVLLTLRAQPMLDYLGAAAQTLHQPQRYISAVLAAQPHLRAQEAQP